MRLIFTFRNNNVLLTNTMITWRIVDQDGVQTHNGASNTDDPGGVFRTDDEANPLKIKVGSNCFYTVLGETRSFTLIGVGGVDLIQKTIRLNIAVGGAAGGGAVAPVGPERVNFTNPERLWLTYETRFNWPQFLKTNQK